MKFLSKRSSLTVIFLWMAHIAIVNGQEKLGQSGLQFLEIGTSPRAEAMGGAFVLAGNNADAVFYNPAGIAKNASPIDVTVNRVQWFADINYNAFGATYQPALGEYGVIGLMIVSADYGDFYGTRVAAGTTEGYEDTGIFSPTAIAIGLNYAKELNDRFTVGGQVKYLHQGLGSNIITAGGSEKANSISGVAFDFGMMYSTPIRGFNFGMSIKNFATDFKYEEYSFEAPLTFRIGLELNVFDFIGETESTDNFIIVADAVHPRDFGEHVDLGTEYKLANLVAFRLGYKMNYSEEGLTAGLGLNYNVLSDISMRVDYSYGSFGIWDYVQRFSIGFAIN